MALSNVRHHAITTAANNIAAEQKYWHVRGALKSSKKDSELVFPYWDATQKPLMNFEKWKAWIFENWKTKFC